MKKADAAKAVVVLTLIALAVALVKCGAARASVFPAQYDRSIRQASERYLPGIPWRLLKAQLYQESKLDPSARSPAGAEGIAQFMGPTWAEVSRHLGYNGIPRQAAGPAIDAAAYYMASLRRSWPLDDLSRHWLAAASYNAGIGNIKKAAKACPGETWEAVFPCLPSITGRHSAETGTYIERIRRWWLMMEMS